MNDPLYGGMQDILWEHSKEMLRDHIARTLGPSPLTVRLRSKPFLSREQARNIADVVINAMDKEPDKGAAILKAIYMPEVCDE